MTALALDPQWTAQPAVPAREDLARLLMIRHFELALLDLFAQGQVNGTTHTCLGQEYVPVSLQPLLDERDYIFSNHRGHGHYLSRFDDPEGLLAEITGRQGAVCGGAGGSQHLRRDRYQSTGVQGESVPTATGVALHLSRHEPGLLACAFIGDGTWGQGVVYEALNMAVLWCLPLLLVVEHNGIAQSTPTAAQMAGTIAARAAAFGAAYQQVTGVDVAAIRQRLRGPIAQVRGGRGPLVVEFQTVRLGPHSKGDDPRPLDELERLRAFDWLPRYAQAGGALFSDVDRQQRARIARVFAEVLPRPLAGGPGHQPQRQGGHG